MPENESESITWAARDFKLGENRGGTMLGRRGFLPSVGFGSLLLDAVLATAARSIARGNGKVVATNEVEREGLEWASRARGPLYASNQRVILGKQMAAI